MIKPVVIITGGGQRIGLALAHSLLDQGHHVLVTYRTHRGAIEKLKSIGVSCFQADLTVESECDAFIRYVSKNHTSIRAIIHNASSWLPERPGQSHNRTLNENFNIHVNVPYILNMAFSKLLTHFAKVNNSMADIIHMTDYVVEKGSKKHIAYAASKAALANMTLSFGVALAPYVKVNNIAPALLMFNKDDDDDYKEKASKKSLLPAAPGAQEAVNTLNYIMTSQYVTGRTFSLDGGRQLKG